MYLIIHSLRNFIPFPCNFRQKHKNKKECAKINNGTIERFNNKEFKALAASKQVNQGQNFVDLNVAIYQSYNSSSTNKGQRDGRLARLPKNRIGYNITD